MPAERVVSVGAAREISVANASLPDDEFALGGRARCKEVVAQDTTCAAPTAATSGSPLPHHGVELIDLCLLHEVEPWQHIAHSSAAVGGAAEVAHPHAASPPALNTSGRVSVGQDPASQICMAAIHPQSALDAARAFAEEAAAAIERLGVDEADTIAADAPNPASVQLPCIDLFESCDDWAAMGECSGTPSFMLTKCARSCGACRST